MMFWFTVFSFIIIIASQETLTQINQMIQSLQRADRIYTAQRCRLYPQEICSVIKQQQQYQSILPIYDFPFTKKCQFPNSSNPLLFTTNNKLYIGVNRQANYSFEIYSDTCQLITQILNVNMRYLLCERGICLNGIIYFISEKNELYSWVNYSPYPKFTFIALLENQSEVVGAICRIKGHQKLQIFVAYKSGIIKVYNQLGKIHLNINSEVTRQINIMIDHHPFPLILSERSWISLLDTNQYVQIRSDCPFIKNIQYIFTQTVFSQTIYALTSSEIFFLEMKNARNQCKFMKNIEHNSKINKEDQNIYYKDTFFLANSIKNVSSQIKYDIPCNYSKYNIQLEKSLQKTTYIAHSCCKDSFCDVDIFEIKQQSQSKLFLIITLFVFFFIVLIPCKIFTNKQPRLNYDEEITFRAAKQKDQLLYYLPNQPKLNNKRK